MFVQKRFLYMFMILRIGDTPNMIVMQRLGDTCVLITYTWKGMVPDETWRSLTKVQECMYKTIAHGSPHHTFSDAT